LSPDPDNILSALAESIQLNYSRASRFSGDVMSYLPWHLSITVRLQLAVRHGHGLFKADL
jgi:hypothetical protein